MKNQRAVTIVELLIVIVVVSIVATISIVAVGNIVESTRERADQANVSRLNQTTRLFKLANPSDTTFNNPTNTETILMNKLIEKGFIGSLITPLANDGKFSFDFSKQVWLYNAQFVLSEDDVADFDPGFFGGNAIVGPYSGTNPDIVIPDIISGNIIKFIYQDAFSFNAENSEVQLTSVSFTSGSQLERIHARAFQNNNLTQIALPDSLVRIDLRAFINNPNLTSVTIGPHVTTIENDAFLGGNTFREAYFIHGAGTYHYNGVDWIKQ